VNPLRALLRHYPGGRTLCLLAIMLASLTPGCVSFHRGPMAGEPKDASFATIEGTRVHYVDRGHDQTTKPPVVLIHGFASSLRAWATVMPLLEKDRRVIALDLKGFGWTDRPVGDYSPAAQARIVLGLMDELGVDRAQIVAHSWGSSVALALTLAAPQRVERIALYDAWVYEEQLPSTFLWARADGVGEAIFAMFYKERPDEKIALAFHDERMVTQELVDEVRSQLDRPGTTAAALAAVRGQRFYEMQKKYRTIEQPVLLLWGREDRVATLDVGERLSQELPNARLTVYPQCGHFPMLEALASSNRDLLAFLDAPTTTATTPAVVTPTPVPAPPLVDPEPAPPPSETDEPSAPRTEDPDLED